MRPVLCPHNTFFPIPILLLCSSGFVWFSCVVIYFLFWGFYLPHPAFHHGLVGGMCNAFIYKARSHYVNNNHMRCYWGFAFTLFRESNLTFFLAVSSVV